jgi:hypothetical protein
MEHSYLRNRFVMSVSSLLCEEGGFWSSGSSDPGVCLAWAGDYADEEPGSENNLYGASRDCPDLATVGGIRMSKYPFLLNHDKKLFVSIASFQKDHFENDQLGDRLGDRLGDLHPLPILTVEGNGRGGGDLPLTHPWASIAGTWARNLLSLSDSRPLVSAGWTELLLPERE